MFKSNAHSLIPRLRAQAKHATLQKHREELASEKELQMAYNEDVIKELEKEHTQKMKDLAEKQKLVRNNQAVMMMLFITGPEVLKV